MYADITTGSINTAEGSKVEYQCKEGYALNSTSLAKGFTYTRWCNKTNPTSNLPGPVGWTEPPERCEGNYIEHWLLHTENNRSKIYNAL